jgi:hypothetical protein
MDVSSLTKLNLGDIKFLINICSGDKKEQGDVAVIAPIYWNCFLTLSYSTYRLAKMVGILLVYILKIRATTTEIDTYIEE